MDDEPMPIRQPPAMLRQRLTHQTAVAAALAWILPAAAAGGYVASHRRNLLLAVAGLLILALLIDAWLWVRLSKGKQQLAVHYPRVELWEPPPDDDQGVAPLAKLQANLIEDVPVVTEQGSLSRHRSQRYELMLTPGVFIAGVGVLSHRDGPSGTYGIQMALCDHSMRRLVSDVGEWGAFFRYAVVKPGAYVLELQCVAGQQLEYLLMHQHQQAGLSRVEVQHPVGVHASSAGPPPLPPPPPPPPPPR